MFYLGSSVKDNKTTKKSCKTTMDKLALSMVFRIICFLILYGDISSQPLYENSREDRITAKETEFYYQNVYERENFLENQENSWKKKLDLCRETLPFDCKELYMNGIRKSGVYTIYPWEKTDPDYRPIKVYCDMESEGGGWTAIQRRVNGEETFTRNWTEYKLGFGTPYGDYWIGNEAIHQLTTGRNSSLYVTITPMDGGVVSFKMYHQFYVFGEDQNYTLQVANPGSGSLDDRLVWNDADFKTTGMQFSTFDVDNDKYIHNCAAAHLGGWWFNRCHSAFLNGLWHSGDWRSAWYSQYLSGREVNGTSMLIKSH
uniref:Fibrinogen C-terminal domain-containing protein n=1 Tax=Magallana gigas TaxID=29159 RepID=A0A8W8NX60_MAGGI|nr:microfibril-associated glycoprotein 4-like [Crassostrea gigas]